MKRKAPIKYILTADESFEAIVEYIKNRHGSIEDGDADLVVDYTEKNGKLKDFIGLTVKIKSN